MAIDAAPIISKNDDRFGTISEVRKAGPPARPFPRASNPHHNKANALFFDGTVRQVDAYKELASWMILAPGNLNNPGAEHYTTDPNSVWQPGRTLPF